MRERIRVMGEQEQGNRRNQSRAAGIQSVGNFSATAVVGGVCQEGPVSKKLILGLATAIAIAATVSNGGSMKDFKKPADAELKKKLTPIQYDVTQHEGTEPPLRNEDWNTHQAGIYAAGASGEPLFSSLDKFESGTGWPSFTKP